MHRTRVGKRFLRTAIVGLVFAAFASPHRVFAQGGSAGPPTAFVLSDAETLAGWGSGTSLSNDCKEGTHSVAWRPAPIGGAAFLTLALGDKRDRVARGKTLLFWYRFEGQGATTFHLKAIAAPLASGWQAIYTLPIPPAGQWRRAVVALQSFEDQWGDTPDTRNGRLEFRVQTTSGATTRLLLDDLQVVPLVPGAPVNPGTRGLEPSLPKPLIATNSPLRLPSHPRLLFSAADLPVIRGRIGRSSWAATFANDLKRRSDDWLTRAVQLPPRGGQWWHWYACPTHGTRLRTESPTRHVCPTGGEVYTGYPYDDVVMSAQHDELATSARDLGLQYQLSGDRRYAAKAREILLAYADKYLSYPLHNINGEAKVGGGRVLPQTLDESIWLIAMAQGADAIWDTLTPVEIESLKTRLFDPAAALIRQHRLEIHNIQCWKNSAVGLVGLLLEDVELLADAIDSAWGYQAQMAQGVNSDGAWYEGAWGYHFYTMDAVRGLTEAAFRCGLNLYGESYRRMFLAPLEQAMPNGRLPAFNDSETATALGNANYEIALARYGDARLAGPLAASNRRNLQAFINGVDPLPEAKATPGVSQNFPASGYAVLRAGAGTGAAWLCLKYGPHGGGHGHPDKNSFVLAAGGRTVADDPGTAAYGVPIHAGWYKTTLAHNTLTVDQTSQVPATGFCLDFQTREAWSATLTDAGDAIPGVTFERATFLIGENLVAFLDLVSADDGTAHTLDLAYHPAGTWATPPSGASTTAPSLPGYSYLRDLRGVTSSLGLTLGIAAEGALKSWITFAGSTETPTTFYTGTGVGANAEDRVPILIARRQTTATAYAWAVALTGTGSAPVVTPVRVTAADDTPLWPGSAAAARITHAGKTYLVIANPYGQPLKAGSWSGTEKLAVVPQD